MVSDGLLAGQGAGIAATRWFCCRAGCRGQRCRWPEPTGVVRAGTLPVRTTVAGAAQVRVWPGRATRSRTRTPPRPSCHTAWVGLVLRLAEHVGRGPEADAGRQPLLLPVELRIRDPMREHQRGVF